MVPPYSTRISRVPAYSFVHCTNVAFRVRGYHPLWSTFQSVPLISIATCNRAVPRSLAATKRISVDFFSSGYLDVSVPRVRFLHLCIQCKITILRWLGSPIRTSPDQSSVCQLPEAFRRLPRPSSPLTAKASTVCASSLDHITPSNLVILCKTTFAENSNFSIKRTHKFYLSLIRYQ